MKKIEEYFNNPVNVNEFLESEAALQLEGKIIDKLSIQFSEKLQKIEHRIKELETAI